MAEELKQGTPEYQEAYDKEIKRLEAEANGSPEKVEQAATTTSDAKVEAEPKAEADAVKADAADVANERLAKIEKALEDTKRYARAKANEVAKLKKELDAKAYQAEKPAILDANPGLEDAIKHVSGTAKPITHNENWTLTVGTAIPDIESFLADQSFRYKAQARRLELGEDWDDPIIAIRELSELKTSHLSNRASASAVEAARKDWESKSKKRSAMAMPGGSGGKGGESGTVDEVKKWQTMPDADFDKQRRSVLGY